MTTQPFHQVEHAVAEPHAADMPGQGKAPANRSLERGLDVLRAFRPGTEYLTNGDLSDLLGLAKSTVSRLTQTLVRTGFLDYDGGRSAYRLAPTFLGLAHAMHQGSSLLQAASPLMIKVAREHQVNVSLAAADRDEMIYLESIRLSQRKTPRNVLVGQRLPMDITSLGRACLAGLGEAQRETLIATFCARRCEARRAPLEQEIRRRPCQRPQQGLLPGCLATRSGRHRHPPRPPRLSHPCPQHQPGHPAVGGGDRGALCRGAAGIGREDQGGVWE